MSRRWARVDGPRRIIGIGVLTTAALIGVATHGVGVATRGSAASTTTGGGTKTATKTYTVDCTTSAGPSQSEDIATAVEVPASVVAGSQFTVTFPGLLTQLPDNHNVVIKLSAYKDTSALYTFAGATVLSGTGGQGTNNSTHYTAVTTVPSAHVFSATAAGPFAPGTLTAPTYAVTAQATGAVGSSVTFPTAQISLTVEVAGIGDVRSVCTLPTSDLVSIPITAAASPPTAAAAAPPTAAAVVHPPAATPVAAVVHPAAATQIAAAASTPAPGADPGTAMPTVTVGAVQAAATAQTPNTGVSDPVWQGLMLLLGGALLIAAAWWITPPVRRTNWASWP